MGGRTARPSSALSPCLPVPIYLMFSATPRATAQGKLPHTSCCPLGCSCPPRLRSWCPLSQRDVGDIGQTWALGDLESLSFLFFSFLIYKNTKYSNVENQKNPTFSPNTTEGHAFCFIFSHFFSPLLILLKANAFLNIKF